MQHDDFLPLADYFIYLQVCCHFCCCFEEMRQFLMPTLLVFKRIFKQLPRNAAAQHQLGEQKAKDGHANYRNCRFKEFCQFVKATNKSVTFCRITCGYKCIYIRVYVYVGVLIFMCNRPLTSDINELIRNSIHISSV